MEMSFFEKWRRKFLREANTLQPHKQAALVELSDNVMMHHCESIRNRLSHGVPINTVADEWRQVADILDKYRETTNGQA